MKSANVYRNGERVGVLIRHERNSYEFEYDDQWFNNPEKPAVSLTMPKSKKTYKADHLFPFFYNLLSEGVNRKLQSRQLKIDEKNYFDLLLETAQTDTIGAITLKSKNK
ncbi:phosphatidylinositol kinase [Rhodohalobacter sp. SW132]|uniref:HipA N-terminal domain-containing protein n=1 Tax=Rhodohalobacter sp. SW132 TaxID=2293433 RepID=UPI000E251F56|nr:HipA N-terminal domain-containing protein [Rhodohalobacter sp. SW132]REL32977.1 phosphatidylinositol kinase [Rhodohalobacter sp. SW132]